MDGFWDDPAGWIERIATGAPAPLHRCGVCGLDIRPEDDVLGVVVNWSAARRLTFKGERHYHRGPCHAARRAAEPSR